MQETSLSLLSRVQAHADEDARQRVLELYAPLIERWLAGLELQAADRDDLVQEVLSTLVRELPGFRHNGRAGAFRAWLRGMTVNRLREFWRLRKQQPTGTGDTAFASMLQQLDSPESSLSCLWDAEHDRHVVRQLLARIEPLFEPPTREAFRRVVLEGKKAAIVAAELGLSVNAVLLAKSRVLQQLRREMEGFLD